MRYVEDPSINAAARAEAADMVAELCRRYAAGESYFPAREAVMAERGPAIARAYGKGTARRALAYVTSLGPEDLPRDTRHKAADQLLDGMLRDHIDQHGPGFRYTAWQRRLFRWGFGVGKPKRDRSAPRLKGAELERWRAERQELRYAEAAAEMEAKRQAAEEVAAKTAREREIAAQLRDHARRVERGEFRRQDADADRAMAWLRGDGPLLPGRR